MRSSESLGTLHRTFFRDPPPPEDASPNHVTATLCDLITAVWGGLAVKSRHSPAVTRSAMRPHPRPSDVLQLCDRGERRAGCPGPTLNRRSQGQRGALCPTFFPGDASPHPRPSDVLLLCDRGERRACCPEPTHTGGHKVRGASPAHAPATFCDFVTAVRDGLAARSRLSPAVTRSEMRPPPTSQRRSATL